MLLEEYLLLYEEYGELILSVLTDTGICQSPVSESYSPHVSLYGSISIDHWVDSTPEDK